MIKYRQDIDALRGLSVLLVIFYHAFPKFLSGGFVGVDVFFVISGYLITKIIIKQLDHNKFSFLTFYRKRVLRIFPAFLFVMTAVLIIGYLILFNEEYENLAYHIYKSSFFMQNFQLMKEVGYFDISSHYKPLLHIWSLSIEEQFYFVWNIGPLMIHMRLWMIMEFQFQRCWLTSDYTCIITPRSWHLERVQLREVFIFISLR